MSEKGAIMSYRLLIFFIAQLFINVAYAIETTRNIPYTYDGQQTLDLFVPEEIGGQEIPRPAAIVMHSGGWVQGDRYNVENIAVWFANQGFVVINVDYALAPENKWPAQFSDVIQGVWWIKQNAVRYNINPDKVLAVGASSGGYLAAMLGQVSVSNVSNLVDSKVHGIVSFSGAWNLLEATTAEQVYYVSLVLPIDTPQARLLASPVFLINSHSPPVLIFHGTDDKLVPFQQSKYACQVYESKGLNHCFLVPLEGYTHSSEITDLGTVLIIDSLHEFLGWWLAR